LINNENANYSLSGDQLCYDLLVRTPLYTYDHRLTYINISQDSYLLAANRIRMFTVISVDVRLKHFMPYSISVNLNFILLAWFCSIV